MIKVFFKFFLHRNRSSQLCVVYMKVASILIRDLGSYVKHRIKLPLCTMHIVIATLHYAYVIDSWIIDILCSQNCYLVFVILCHLTQLVLLAA